LSRMPKGTKYVKIFEVQKWIQSLLKYYQKVSKNE
jgi:hypothetical protein